MRRRSRLPTLLANSGFSFSYVGQRLHFARGGKIIEGQGLQSSFLIGAYDQVASAVGVKRIPSNAGAATWTMDNTNMWTSAGPIAGIAIGETQAFVYWGDEDGTFNTTGRMVFQAIDLADGTPDWTRAVARVDQGIGHAVTYLSTHGHAYMLEDDSANEIVQVDAATGAELADTSDTTVGVAYSLGHDQSQNYLIVAGSNEQVGFFDATGETIGAQAFEVDVGAGVHTSLVWDTWSTGTPNDETSPCISPGRTSGKLFWLSGGIPSANQVPYLMRGDAALGAVDPATCFPSAYQLNVATHSPLAAGSWRAVASHCVDNVGRVYALLVNSELAADIVVFSPLGVPLLSFLDRNIRVPMAADGVLALDIAVNENYDVGIIDIAGSTWHWRLA